MQKNKAKWNFDHSYTQLPKAFYAKMEPNPVASPKLQVLNTNLAASLGLNINVLYEKEVVDVFAGNAFPKEAFPLAQAYAGHQYGHPNMLGDGRAMLIGEQITPTNDRLDIQLKGSGRTPFSRGVDGRAALGPMLREYIISEAMHALGIPTTRSLAVVTTGESVLREKELPGAILTRVAASHIRVGTFQYAANTENPDDLRSLVDYTIDRHYPFLQNSDNPYLSFLKEVVKRQAELIAKWQLVGFIHGVMNTDNMTISGETIDYGPCAFMDVYHLDTVFSSIDTHGRYAYGNQPRIAGWNLARFAETLLPFIHNKQEEAVKLAQEAVYEFTTLYQENWLDGMRKKLGLFHKESQDEALIEDILRILQNNRIDYTNTFRLLTLDRMEESPLDKIDKFTDWYKRWKHRLAEQKESKEAVSDLMQRNNPWIIPRNHRVEEALKAANNGDYSVMEKLLRALSHPFDYESTDTTYCDLPSSCDKPYITYCGT